MCVCMGVCEGGEEGLMVGVAEKTTTNNTTNNNNRFLHFQ